MTIGLGAITRNSECGILRRALESVRGKVDAIYVTVTDGVTPEVEALAKDFGAELSEFAWTGDFSAARNFNMSRCKEDWYVWLDSDDEVEGMEHAESFLSKLPERIGHVLCTYNYSFFPSGKVDNAHPKERFIRTGQGYAWKEPLHEACVKEGAEGVFFDRIVWNHRTDRARTLESSRRNIAIMEAQISKMGKDEKIDPRTVFNLGMALASVAQQTDDKGDWERCVRAFYRYIDMSGWDMHAYMAWRFIGTALTRMGRPELALNAYVECLKIEPAFKDAYASLGQTYMALNDTEKAKTWFQLSLLAGKDNAYASDKSTTLVMPLLALAEMHAKEGKLADAEKYLKFAIKYTGTDDPNIMGMMAEVKAMKTDLKKGTEMASKLKTKDDYDSLDPKWKAHPKVVEWRRSQKFKKSSKGNEIAIYCGQSWETWNPDSEKSGIGGSEEAVINMARELTALGWEVKVYGSHGDSPKSWDGVEYWPFWAFNPQEPVDIFIGWRDPSYFDLPINAKRKYLWLHDVINAASLTEKRVASLDKIMVLSKYHRDLFPKVPDEKFFLTGNGINPNHFVAAQKVKGKVMYASAPNRGLKCLLEMWPKIRERKPEATLYWAYGWQTFDLGSKNNPLMRRYKEEVVKLLQQPGVVELGRLGHEELAKHMAETEVWAYPTEFPEIFCITAVKMQASGAIPVHTGVAAIGEKGICPFGTNLETPDIYENEEAQGKFIDAVIDAMDNPPPREPMVEWAKSAWAWSNTAKSWDAEFKS